MANKKPGFMVYFAEWAPLEELSDAQFREVFRGAMRFAMTGERAGVKDGEARIALSMLIPHLEADAVRYARKVDQAREAGKRSGDARSMNARSNYERTLTDVRKMNGRKRNEPTTANTNSSTTPFSRSERKKMDYDQRIYSQAELSALTEAAFESAAAGNQEGGGNE